MTQKVLRTVTGIAFAAALLAMPVSALGQPGGRRAAGGNNASSSRPSMQSQAPSRQQSGARSSMGAPSQRSDNHGTVSRPSNDNRGLRPDGNRGNGGNFGSRPGNDSRPDGNRNNGGNFGSRPDGNRNNGGNFGSRPGNGSRPDGNRNNGGNFGSRPGNGSRPGGNMGNRPGGNPRPGGSVGHRPPHGGINHGGPRPDYNRFRYHSGFRPRRPHDRWWDYYRYNRWSWRAPIAPPHRAWRPRFVWYFRPRIPVGYSVYASAPIISGVLGLEFGTLLDASLNYLYYNNYSIDGYQDNVVYLRDVTMMGYSWPDVMLQYENGGGLSYAEFATSSSYRDDYRFRNLYNTLCSTYGTPIEGDGYYSWYGGSGTGFINLNFAYQDGRYYTVLTMGA